jgi:hypothetical protein
VAQSFANCFDVGAELQAREHAIAVSRASTSAVEFDLGLLRKNLPTASSGYRLAVAVYVNPLTMKAKVVEAACATP